jgi:hypothetical protein
MTDMQIHVARPPTQLGVFSQEEIAQGLGNGRFFPTDQGWREGMDAWMPLSQWPEFAGLGAVAGVPAAPGGAFAGTADAGPLPSWEHGASMGNFFATFREVATDPVQTFDRLRAEGSFKAPLFFNYVSALPGFVLLFVVYAVLLSFMGEEILGGIRAGGSPALAGLGVGGFLAVLGGGFCCFYLLLPLGQFIGSALFHVLLLPWSPQGGFSGSFRANAYVNGVFFPLTCIPCVNYVAMPWQLVVSVIALSRVHKIAWWKVLLSVVVIPGCACCAIYLAILLPLISRGALR